MVKETCPLCLKYDVDCVKSGQWAMDDICGICLDERILKEGFRGVAQIREVYGNDALLTIVGIGAIADELCRRKVREVKRLNEQ